MLASVCNYTIIPSHHIITHKQKEKTDAEIENNKDRETMIGRDRDSDIETWGREEEVRLRVCQGMGACRVWDLLGMEACHMLVDMMLHHISTSTQSHHTEI